MLQKEIWLITGSQHLYGLETLTSVENNAQQIAAGLNENDLPFISFIAKAVVTTTKEITSICLRASASESCIGVILWMHTFSPAKMWIKGLQLLSKPICHLHTQFNSEIPWDRIDMDFMNLNQSAHGDREMGFMMTRMRLRRKVVVGHWKSSTVRSKIFRWSRVALGWDEMQHLKVARIGDNMREVGVTEGDKVEAQMKFGFSVNGYGVSELSERIDGLLESELNQLVQEYDEMYAMAQSLRKGGDRRSSLIEAARIELGLRRFLDEGSFGAFTNTFENLGTLKQLPGIAVQRLMADGFGFGAEGDWKTAALLRVIKVMSMGLEGGNSFMEDYTYHFADEQSYVLGAHMLEICPTIAAARPSCEVHSLGIGGKDDPVRLVFNGKKGPAINASLIDMGKRFRLIVNEVEAIAPLQDLPKLPVARVLWEAKPSLEVAATAWILAGGAHHTVYSQSLTAEYLEDFAEIAGIEVLVIDSDTKIRHFKETMRANEGYYGLM